MKDDAIRIFSKDLEQDAKFYENILGFKKTFVDKQRRCIGYQGRDCSLILEDGSEFPEMIGRFIALSFLTQNLKDECKTLKNKGVIFHSFPEPTEDGYLLAHFNDYSGNTLTLVQEYI